MNRIQFYLTPAAGKVLIAKAISALPEVQKALRENTILIVAGTSNAPVAYELLRQIGRDAEFCASRFFRGITTPPGASASCDLIGDVVIQKGEWLKGKEVYDICDRLGKGDLLLKGANAVNLEESAAGVLLGNPAGGTVIPLMTAVYGKRARLIIPVGVEKRVTERISKIEALVNHPESQGLRFASLPGEVVTELEAISMLTGAKGYLIGGGGVLGAEGGAYFLAGGAPEQLDALRVLVKSIQKEPLFHL